MSETEPMKVYELAKELGMDSISLVDKLNGLGISVKSHMSALEPPQVSAAREALSVKTTKAKTPAKKAGAVVKRAAASGTGATAAGAATTTTTTAAKPAASRKKAAAAPAASASPILRRRTQEEAGTRTTTIVDHGTPATPASTSAPETAPETEPTSTSEIGTAVDTAAETSLEASSNPAAEGASETAPASAAPSTSPDAAAAPVAARRKILTVVNLEAPKPKPKPKIVAPAARTTPANSQTQTDPTGKGGKIIKMSKERLDKMAEEEAAKKKANPREKDAIRPEDVRFADYRKKEVVFLPRKKRVPVGKDLKSTQRTVAAAHKRVVEMQDTIAVSDLAAQMGVKANEVIHKLINMGQMATVNQAVDLDTATLVANEFKFEVKSIAFKEEALFDRTEDKSEDLVLRPPVVTIMGHVDHGKTSLLDAIRDANVASGEAGGITQHIGAYTIEKNGKLITFIDTPGHEAFTVMRARGANVTDIVILVVAADDGVMPQTREALSHAQAAKVPIIVAVNKMDKPGANPEKIKQGLAELNLLSEDWGGDTMFIPVSAIKKTGLNELLEAINLNAEVLELKANPKRRANGTVLEARLEKGRGPVVSLLVKNGTLRVGENLVIGVQAGRVRAMHNHLGQNVKEVTPGMAAEILGMEGVPGAGDRFEATESDGDSRKIISNRQEQQRVKAASTSKMSLEDLFAKVSAGNLKELKVILKADVFGSLEAIRDSLTKLSTEKVKVSVIQAAPGGITESDVMLASASEAIIVGFNVRPENQARRTAESEKVEIKTYTIIYELIDDIKQAMLGMLDKKKVEKFLGRAQVRQTFSVPKVGTIAGSSVVDGKITRNANVRLLRDSVILYEGKLSSLKRFKDDAREVATGYECGIALENYNDVKEGDVIEAYDVEFITPELTV
ncbi:MAG: translation initiation factor IF-2 [Bacteriovoracia bacterium]